MGPVSLDEADEVSTATVVAFWMATFALLPIISDDGLGLIDLGPLAPASPSVNAPKESSPRISLNSDLVIFCIAALAIVPFADIGLELSDLGQLVSSSSVDA